MLAVKTERTLTGFTQNNDDLPDHRPSSFGQYGHGANYVEQRQAQTAEVLADVLKGGVNLVAKITLLKKFDHGLGFSNETFAR